MLLITTPVSNPSKHYRHFRKAVASGQGHFQDFRPGFRFWHICHVDRHGHFTLKQLRLSLVNKTHTKPCTGPRQYTIVVGYRFEYGYRRMSTATKFLILKSSRKNLYLYSLRRMRCLLEMKVKVSEFLSSRHMAV